MTTNTSNNLSSFSQMYSAKKCVSPVTLGFYIFLLISFVGVNIFFAFKFGHLLGDTETEAYIIGYAFILMEGAFSVFCWHKLPPRYKNMLTTWTIPVLFLFSFLTIAAYLVAKQSTADSIQIESQKTLIASIQKRIDGLNPTEDRWNFRDATRELANEQEKLGKLIEEAGGEYTGPVNTIFRWASDVTGLSYQFVSLTFKLVWSMVFVLVTQGLAGIIGECYTVRGVKKQAKTMGSGVLAVKEADITYAELADATPAPSSKKLPILHYKAPKNIKKGGTREGRSFDTGTEGQNTNRYETIKSKIRVGEIKPVVSQVRRAANCGAEVARSYLEGMAKEGVLSSKETSRGVTYSLD